MRRVAIALILAALAIGTLVVVRRLLKGKWAESEEEEIVPGFAC